MPAIALDKSIEIGAPPEKVFSIVSDLGNWRPWNPWLVTDPEVSLEITNSGKSYRWEGQRTGQGSMRVVDENKNRSVDLELVFLKPFRSEAKVRFELEATETGCTVTWSMNSQLPFFLFFLKKMMTTMIGMDYERGLAMLKDYAETGQVPSAIEYPGESTFAGCQYVGISRQCSLATMPEAMQADFAQLQQWLEQTGKAPSGDAFSIYRKWDLSAGRVHYTCGLPLEQVPEQLPAALESGSIPPLKTYVLEHIGPYRHLGNAWSTAMQMGRGKEFRPSKAHPPFETYLVGKDGKLPGADSSEAARTRIHFAVK